MSKHQTRRTISFNRDFYNLARTEAARDGISLANWITDIVRLALTTRGIAVPTTQHMKIEDVVKAVKKRTRTWRGART